jgi:hypothetical protein
MSSEVQVQGGAAGGSGESGGQGQGGATQPGWAERAKHRMMKEAVCRDLERTEARRFDG